MRNRWIVLALVLAAPAPVLAQRPDGPRQNEPRRQMLQAQVGAKFMEQVSRRLKLDEGTRNRLQQHLRLSGEARRDLAERSQILRLQLMRAVRDSSTSDAELHRLLGEANALRQREYELWRQDQEALGGILTPRQQAQFLFMWMRFNEQIREIKRSGPPRGF